MKTLRNALKNPMFLAGFIVLILGIIILDGYNPNDYKQESSKFVKTPEKAAKMQYENSQKEKNQNMHFILILGSLGFGLIMLGSGFYQTKKKMNLVSKE